MWLLGAMTVRTPPFGVMHLHTHALGGPDRERKNSSCE